MRQILPFVQIFLGALLIGAILLQQRGASLGAAFGGEGASYSSRRGIEKTLFGITIAIALLFAASTIASLLLR